MSQDGKDSLGLNRKIPRRDVIRGLGAVAVGSMLSGCSPEADRRSDIGLEQASLPASSPPAASPPALTGMRGSHDGSFTAAHEHVSNPQPLPALDDAAARYDLVVVGAGLSGLAAAYFYKQQHRDAKILILDNHDDFGGHARRNEFTVNGRQLIGYGGSQTMSEPSSYSDTVKALLGDLDIELSRFESAYDQDFYRRNELGPGIHFDKANFGVERVVRYDLGVFDGYIPLALSELSPAEMVQQMPITPAARQQLLEIITTTEDRLPQYQGWDKQSYLYYISYKAFLQQHLDVSEPDVFRVLQNLPFDSGVGIDAVDALTALEFSGLPGWDAAGLGHYEAREAYIHHFPDGNASIARALVAKLMPAVVGTASVDALMTSTVNYAALDQPGQDVRLRLQSTVLQVENDSNGQSVSVVYQRGDQKAGVRADHCIMAGYSSMLPYIIKGLPEAQAAALSEQVKVPVLYTNVALRNWQAWSNMKLGGAIAPAGYHVTACLDFPVTWGDYQHPKNPDEPILVHMERFPHHANAGLSAKQQHRLGREELRSTSFATIERNIRTQLGGMLAEGGFDPARDIEAITVNRWGHGYASWYNPLFEENYDDDDDPRYAHVRGRKRFGRIAIAGSDSAAIALLDAAIDQAARAVDELQQA
ncbi:MAG: FAD/NAD(P)-binding protein [Pseudomonadota bacterium]